jgi:elongation factor 1 alpha-like protein
LLEKATVKLQPVTPTITVTPTAKKANVTRGFEVNSPVTSGRNTPEPQPPPKPKETTRNAKELYESERGGLKPTLHMVVIGHVDAGKSTLMGHLLFDMGNVPQRGEILKILLNLKIVNTFRQ